MNTIRQPVPRDVIKTMLLSVMYFKCYYCIFRIFHTVYIFLSVWFVVDNFMIWRVQIVNKNGILCECKLFDVIILLFIFRCDHNFKELKFMTFFHLNKNNIINFFYKNIVNWQINFFIWMKHNMVEGVNRIMTMSCHEFSIDVCVRFQAWRYYNIQIVKLYNFDVIKKQLLFSFLIN